jgi:hypothetical protein
MAFDLTPMIISFGVMSTPHVCLLSLCWRQQERRRTERESISRIIHITAAWLPTSTPRN